jgi:hypothetical protein
MQYERQTSSIECPYLAIPRFAASTHRRLLRFRTDARKNFLVKIVVADVAVFIDVTSLAATLPFA